MTIKYRKGNPCFEEGNYEVLYDQIAEVFRRGCKSDYWSI